MGTMKILLVRHASPDWSRTDVPYDIEPGPPLSPRGEREAEELAMYLKSQGVAKLYYSPFERSARTAMIISTIIGIPCVAEKRLTEWRAAEETEEGVAERMSAVFDDVSKESASVGPIGLVSHGGPITFLLLDIGIDRERLAAFRRKFDRSNPLPPAGAWEVKWNEEGDSWDLDLRFIPSVG